jgi:hypothetical protein
MRVLMVVVVLILTSLQQRGPSRGPAAVSYVQLGFRCVHKKMGCVGKVRYAALSGSVSTRGIDGLGVACVAVSGAYDAPLPRPCPLR